MNKHIISNNVAIVHDIIFAHGGAEVVLDVICSLYPTAHLFTLAIDPSAKTTFLKKHPLTTLHTSLFHYIPGLFKTGKHLSFIKLFSWIYWELLNLKNFSLIISSSHSFGAKAVKHKKDALHISYVHTPPKYLYSEFSELEMLKKIPYSIITQPFFYLLRHIDKRGASRPDILIANSKDVQKRIQRYYKRSSIVIYPPVAMPHKLRRAQKKYYLCLSRLSKQKGVELAVQTCTKYKLPLLVVGSGSELERLKNIAGPTVTFFGSCSESQKPYLYASAKALLYPSIDEDFGITPVEAMSYGIPVIAFDSGGARETVIHGKTGVLFRSHTTDSLKRAIDTLKNVNIRPNFCKLWAYTFSRKQFQRQIVSLINDSTMLVS